MPGFNQAVNPEEIDTRLYLSIHQASFTRGLCMPSHSSSKAILDAYRPDPKHVVCCFRVTRVTSVSWIPCAI